MSGLLDGYMDDPGQMALLSLGLRLLSTPGPFGQALGQSGLGALTDARKSKEWGLANKRAQLEDEALRMRMEQAKRAQAEAEAAAAREAAVRDAYRGAFRTPEQAAVSANGGPTMAAAAAAPKMQQGFDQAALIRSLAEIDPVMAFKMAQPAPDELMTVAPGASVLSKRDPSKPVYTAPSAEKSDEFIARMKAAGIDPASPQGQMLLRQKLEKEATHPDPISIANYGPAAPMTLPDGRTVMVQTGNKPGAPPQIVTDPATNKPMGPPPNPAAQKDPTEFQAKAGLYFKSMQTASQTLDSIEKTNGWRPGLAETAVPGETGKTLVSSETRQKYKQAQRQWIDSINRVRSGANLPELEYERAVMTFFPTFGEGDSIRAQKAAARKAEETAMAEAAGRALKDQPATETKSDGWSIKRKGAP